MKLKDIEIVGRIAFHILEKPRKGDDFLYVSLAVTEQNFMALAEDVAASLDLPPNFTIKFPLSLNRFKKHHILFFKRKIRNDKDTVPVTGPNGLPFKDKILKGFQIKVTGEVNYKINEKTQVCQIGLKLISVQLIKAIFPSKSEKVRYRVALNQSGAFRDPFTKKEKHKGRIDKKYDEEEGDLV